MVERPDVLVIGAGPAGLAAAAAAAGAGARVMLVDDNPAAGGQIWRADRGRPAAEIGPFLKEIADVDHRRSTEVVDVAVDGTWTLRSDRDRLDVAPSKVVLATGARELFLPVPGWTRPGVFGVGGLQALCKQGLDVTGKRILVAGSGPLMLAVAASLRARGAHVVALLEQAPRGRVYALGPALLTRPRKLAQAMQLQAKLRGVPKVFGDWLVRMDDAGSATTRAGRRFEADLIALGFGLVPETRIARYLGCAVDDGGPVVVDENQQSSVPGVFVAGEPTGIGGLDKAVAEGHVAGCAAAGVADRARAMQSRVRRERQWVTALAEAFALNPELRALPDDDTILCRCEDVTWGRVAGYATMRAVKLQTRCGMGSCQARVCGPAIEFLTGLQAERIRPPFVPVELEMLTRS